MDMWEWSWVTVLALVGGALNGILPVLMSRMEKGVSYNVRLPANIPNAQAAYSGAISFLRTIGRERRRWVYLGLPLWVIALATAGLSQHFRIPVAIPLSLVGLGLVIALYTYYKWQLTFQPQSFINLFESLQQKITTMKLVASQTKRE